ncbi:MAG TPA: hypothetical protein VK184_10355 [Nostocaceae cyanobacterium]|nr:hypothetical protein [Nostocaceae cyanobacterium]
MKFLLYLVMALFMTVFSGSSQAVLYQITQRQMIGEYNVSIKSISIVADLPWSTPEIKEPILRLMTSSSLDPELVVRETPTLKRSPNGKLWLLVKGTVLAQEGNSWQVIKIDAAQIDRLMSIAPLNDNSIIILGRNGKDNVLAAIDSQGKLLWRRTGLYDTDNLDLPKLCGNFNSLLVDIDGKVYLPGTRIYGAVAIINPVTGATPKILDFGEYDGGDVYIHNGELFYILAIDSLRHWVRHSIATNQSSKVVGSEEMQEIFYNVLGVLPGGGALIEQDGYLSWMSPQGKTIKKLTFAGIVRYSQDVFAAIHDNEQIKVMYFSEKPETNYQEVLDSLPNAQLVRANPSGYEFLAASDQPNILRLIHVDRITKQRHETLLSNENLLEFDNDISLLNSMIIDSNSLLLVGTDANGAFVIRVELFN